MAREEGQKVLLYVYDLSQGFAAQVSQRLLGKHVSSLVFTVCLCPLCRETPHLYM